MRKLLTFFDADSMFANAGQAAVERLTLRNLVNSRSWGVRAVAAGDPRALCRLEAFYRDEMETDDVEIVPFPPESAAAVLEGVSLIYVHSLLGWGQSRWLMKHNIWLARPTVQFVHAFGLSLQEQVAWGAWWGHWKGWPPSRLIAPSEVTARRVRSILGMAATFGGSLPEVMVIPHGVDADVGSSASREQARAALSCAPESDVILSLARLSPEKLPYRQLVSAFLILRRRYPERDLRLVLAGGVAPQDRLYVDEIQEFAMKLGLSDEVTIIEHASVEQKRALFGAADLFVSPACHPQESFGLALLEAMAAGLPIVASDWNGYPEVLPVEYRPYLVPTIADHDSARNLEYVRLGEACAVDFTRLVEILELVICDPQLRQKLITAGGVQAQRLSWRENTRRILEVMDHLVQEFDTGKSDFRVRTKGSPLCSPVSELASSYLTEDTRLRSSGLQREMRDVPISAVEEIVVRACGDRSEVPLSALSAFFHGDVLLRNRVVMQLLRSGHLSVAQ